MNRLQRKIAQLFLLTAVLAVAGVHGYYYARELIAKWAFAHHTYFAADELIQIAIPQTDLILGNDYLVNENEFNWQGQMVDVLYREVRSDTLYIYGFRDEAETGLNQQAAGLYRDPAQSDQLPNARLKQIHWESTICPPYRIPSAYIKSVKLPDPKTIFHHLASRPSLPYREVPCPPPN